MSGGRQDEKWRVGGARHPVIKNEDNVIQNNYLSCIYHVSITGGSITGDCLAKLRLAGRLVFDLHNKPSLVCCSGCDSFDIKNSRSNVST